MSTTVNGRRIKVTGQEDERLASKPTRLLECEADAHVWEKVLTNGVWALHAHEYEGRRIVKVAAVKKCANCETIRKKIYWYPDFTPIGITYTNRPTGAKPTYVEGAPRLSKHDKLLAFMLRQQDSIGLVAG